jgi:undecaprenyl diphosphate synthase
MLDKNNIPRHVAIIMDGNGRWARQRGLPRTAGHRAGIKNVEQIIKAASELGIKIVTLFAFSRENWQRPKKEIGMLMRAFHSFLDKEINKLHKNNVRLRVIGRHKPLAPELLTRIRQAERLTASNSGLSVVVALNYSGRQEILDALAGIVRSVQEDNYKLSQLSEKTFSRFLYAPDLPFPDLLIRTSGELRISNFLLWQLAYTELYFTEKFWPDFKRQDLIKAIGVYQKRERRFGGI